MQYLTERGVVRSLIDMEDALWALLLLDSRTFGNNSSWKRFFYSKLPLAETHFPLSYGNRLKIIQNDSYIWVRIWLLNVISTNRNLNIGWQKLFPQQTPRSHHFVLGSICFKRLRSKGGIDVCTARVLLLVWNCVISFHHVNNFSCHKLGSLEKHFGLFWVLLLLRVLVTETARDWFWRTENFSSMWH